MPYIVWYGDYLEIGRSSHGSRPISWCQLWGFAPGGLLFWYSAMRFSLFVSKNRNKNNCRWWPGLLASPKMTGKCLSYLGLFAAPRNPWATGKGVAKCRIKLWKFHNFAHYYLQSSTRSWINDTLYLWDKKNIQNHCRIITWAVWYLKLVHQWGETQNGKPVQTTKALLQSENLDPCACKILIFASNTLNSPNSVGGKLVWK